MKFTEFTESDLCLLKQIFQNSDVMRYTLDDPYTNAEIVNYLERIMANNRAGSYRRQYEYKVSVDGRNVGFADLEIVRAMPCGGIAEIGYLLLPQEWHKGYATVACNKLIEICFDKLKLHKAVASCNEENIGSWHVMEKCGMSREGKLLNHRYKNGRFVHELKYAILNQAYFRQGNNTRPSL